MKKMSIERYLNKMKKIQAKVLDFLDNETNDEESFNELKDKFDKLKISNNKHVFRSFLHLLTQISNDHHRGPFLFTKIEQILNFIKKDIKKYFSNSEIFIIFKRSKRIILSLFEKEIINIDEQIVRQILSKKCIRKNYPQYFWPEIRPFMNEKWFQNRIANYSELKSYIEEFNENEPEKFYEKRKTGENDRYICELIRNDSTQEFIAYINENNISLSSTINSSIYETNNFFLKNKNPSLIEYSAFFGSIEIFKFLLINSVKMPIKSCLCAIHSRNPEIIHLLEANEKIFDTKSIKMYLEESNKCHHNDFLEYFPKFIQIYMLIFNAVLTPIWMKMKELNIF